MKKKLFNKTSLFISLIAVALITAVFVISGSARANTIDFSLNVPATAVNSGEDVTVLFKATTPDIAEFKLAGIQAEFNFDSTYFTIKSVTTLIGEDVLETYKTSGSTLKYICVYDFETDDEGFETLGNILEIKLTAKKSIVNPSAVIEKDDVTVYLGDAKANALSANVSIATTGSITKGDVNGDGKVNTEDAIYLLYNRMIGEASYPVNQSTDFDGDGYIGNSDDAVYLLYHVIFGAEKYPLN